MSTVTKDNISEQPEEDINPLKEVGEPKKYVSELIERQKNFSPNFTFKPGDIVVWKSGLKNRTVPEYEFPGVVINNFHPSLIDDDGSFLSSGYRERLDIEVGFITKYDEFIMFSYDSRRFKLYQHQSQ